jgi:hypothetical protein
MKETTVVEWLENEVSNLVVVTKEYVLILINQAKEMEKEQREKDLESGFHTGRLYLGREGDTTIKELKEKTFKSEQ